jgi:hypothetical protein
MGVSRRYCKYISTVMPVGLTSLFSHCREWQFRQNNQVQHAFCIIVGNDKRRVRSQGSGSGSGFAALSEVALVSSYKKYEAGKKQLTSEEEEGDSFEVMLWSSAENPSYILI